MGAIVSHDEIDFDPGDIINCTVVTKHLLHCDGIDFESEHRYSPGTQWFYIYLSGYIVLVLLAGVFSGLTLGLLSLDETTLQVLLRGGSSSERKHAKRIMPLVKRHHLLLVTLLLANAAAVETMPIFMSKISSEVVAIVVSVTAVLFFGEVFPQAICSRHGLAVGAALVPLVWFLIVIFFVVAWPISKLLDCMLGQNHATFYRRSEIKAIVDIHGEDNGVGERLTDDEVLIINSALDMKTKIGKDAMVPISSVYMLDIESKLDRETLKKIGTAAHSRIPIYEGSPSNIVAILLVKTVISLDPDEATPLRNLIHNRSYSRRPFRRSEDIPLYDLLHEFQKGRSHLCLMTKERPLVGNDGKHEIPEVVGIITLEDVIEELLGEEIVDETDVYMDVHRRIKVAKAMRRGSSAYPTDYADSSDHLERSIGQRPSSNDGGTFFTASEEEEKKPILLSCLKGGAGSKLYMK